MLREMMQIENLLKKPLPGIEAQLEMAPYSRRTRIKQQQIDDNPRHSGIMSLFYKKNGELHILLIVRTSYEGVHSGQIGFPGGKFESTDTSFEHTALRETEEEVGITDITVLGKLTDVYIPPSRFLVYPFVGFKEGEIKPVMEVKEVHDIIELPVKFLLSEEIKTVEKVRLSHGMVIETPCFKYEGHIIWGATAMMLQELRVILSKVKWK